LSNEQTNHPAGQITIGSGTYTTFNNHGNRTGRGPVHSNGGGTHYGLGGDYVIWTEDGGDIWNWAPSGGGSNYGGFLTERHSQTPWPKPTTSVGKSHTGQQRQPNPTDPCQSSRREQTQAPDRRRRPVTV